MALNGMDLDVPALLRFHLPRTFSRTRPLQCVSYYYQIKQYGNTEFEDKDISDNPPIQVDFRDKYAIITITVPVEKSSGILAVLPDIIGESDKEEQE